MALGRTAAKLSPRDRRFVHELTYGATRLRGRLDHLLAKHVDRGLERLDPVAHEILRLGAYQLLHMDGVPRYAAISQAVEQAAETRGRGASGLVNAVLRALADAGGGCERFPDPAEDALGWLITWGSHPEWLVRRWLGRWSAEEVRALVEADNTPPDLVLIPLELGAHAAIVELAEAGIEATPVDGFAPALRVAKGVDPREALAVLPAAVVQDPAAYLVTRYADVPEGTKVADLCAAPGGKAVRVAGKAGFTLAADRSELRMGMVRENVARTGRRVGLVVADARRPPLAAVDVVLLDVPCTGTGTLRRRPDARWRLAPDALATFAALQDELLDAAATLLPPGGLLVYSTCSLEPEENAERVAAFLERRGDFTVAPTDGAPAEHVDANGFLEVLPWRSGFDGAFAARLRRAA